MVSSMLSVAESNFFIDFAMLLVIGIVGGKAAEFLKLPKVTGYIVFGILFGGSFLNVLHEDLIYRYKDLKYFALGLIGYNIGMEVDLNVLKDNHIKVFVYTFFQSILAFVFVGIAVYLLAEHNKWAYALLLGSAAMMTTPAPILACIKSYKISGKITDLVCEMVAIDDIIAVVTFAFVLPISIYLTGHVQDSVSFIQLLSDPIKEVLLSILIGAIIGEIVVRVIQYYNEGDTMSYFLIVIIGIFFGIGLASLYGYSMILLPLTIGFVIRNRLPSKMLHKVMHATDVVIIPVLLLFFTLSGAELQVEYLGMIGTLGLAYLLVRIIGKMTGIYLASKVVKEEDENVKYVGFLMIPQGGIAIDLAILTEIRFTQLSIDTGNPLYSEIGNTIFTVVFASVILYKIFGEIIVKWAYKKTGEQFVEESHVPHQHIV